MTTPSRDRTHFARRARPKLEALEDRLAPSTLLRGTITLANG
jgi:hypothetical protein